MPSSTSSFERPIPVLPWRAVLVATAVLIALATVAWEIRCRAAGYAPTLNDTTDLWAQRREAVQSDSIVVIGDSRALFGVDLNEVERGLGKRPIQLSLAGSCAYPILADFANDERFRGTILCSVVPLMYFAPAGFLLETSEKALRRHRDWTLAQRWSHQLAMLLEETVAFTKQEDLTLSILLQKLPIPNRPHAHIPPPFPPYFQTIDRERRTRMTEACAVPGPLQTRVKEGWLPLFTPPPPPTYVPKAAFAEGVGKAIEARFKDTAAAVKKIEGRGGRVVFVRFPVTGKLKEHEDRLTPRAGPWNRLLSETGAPGIYFEDHPELAAFDLPEWSHLSGPDSVEFTRRLVPHLRKALRQ